MARRPHDREHDAPVPGAMDPELTVLDLVEEMRETRERDAAFYQDAELRDLIVYGDVNPSAAAPTLVENVVPVNGVGHTPMEENRLFPTVTTLVARTDQGRIDSRCRPRTPTAARIAAAEGGNLILDAERQREQRDMTVLETLEHAIVHGKAGIYTTWDPSHGPVEAIEQMADAKGDPLFDQATGLPMMHMVENYGGLRVEVLTVFDYWTSGEDDPKNTRMQIRRRVVDKYTAWQALKAAGIDYEPEETDHPAVGDRKYHGVEVLDLWVKPQAMAPGGCFAVIVDGCVTKVGTWPWKRQRELPITEILFAKRRGSPNGFTPVKGAVKQQTVVNVTQRSILRRTDIAGDARLIATSQIYDQINEEHEGVVQSDPNGPQEDAAAWLVGPDVPETLFRVLQDARAALNDVMGVSGESVTGGDPSSTTSGEQLKTASALDSQKNVPFRRRAEYAFLRVDQQKIELIREMATVPQLWSAAGGPVNAMYLQGADLEGIDVILESASGIAESPLGRARAAEEAAAAGFTSPQDAAEMRQTGTTTTLQTEEQRQRLERQAFGALRGEAQQPDPSLPAQAAARYLRGVMGQVAPGRTALLLRLVAGYEQLAQQQGQMQAAQAGQQQQAPGAPTNGARPKLTETTEQAAKNKQPEGVQ